MLQPSTALRTHVVACILAMWPGSIVAGIETSAGDTVPPDATIDERYFEYAYDQVLDY